MMRKNIFPKALALTLAAATIGVAAQTNSLPTIKMQGTEYYYYRVKKSDSPYGICKKYGWNEDTLRAVNDNIGAKIAKGQTIYYPVSSPDVDIPVIGRIEPVKVTPEPITHTVGRGETIYSIASLYNVPVDLIYQSNPEARNGLRTGDKLTIVQQPINDSSDNSSFFYTVREGDNLTKIAEQYNSDVVSIMKENPAMSERQLYTGQNLRIVPNNRNTTVTKEVREVSTISGFSPYKVAKDDTWESIAAANNITPDLLKEANDAVELPKKGGWIVIPKYKAETKQTIVEAPVAAETTIAQRDEIYRNVHQVTSDKTVDVAVVMSNPAVKNNSEFVRGFLMGVEDQKGNDFKINLKVLDASNGFESNNVDSVLNSSNLIVAIYENDFPSHIADIGRKQGIEVVNVLDSKSNLFELNPQVVQILQPIDYFNDLSVGYLHSNNEDAQLILLGEADESDKFAEKLSEIYPSGSITRLPLDEFAVYPFNPADKYIVYSYALKKDAITEALSAIADAQAKGASIIPVGRAQWVAYASPLNELYGKTGLYVPSRMYINPFDEKQNNFAERFKGIYNASPLVSFPQYAMLGYDIASYFIPTTANNGGDYNTGVYQKYGLQNDIDLSRINDWSGFINTDSYILHYLPEQIVEKIEIK